MKEEKSTTRKVSQPCEQVFTLCCGTRPGSFPIFSTVVTSTRYTAALPGVHPTVFTGHPPDRGTDDSSTPRGLRWGSSLPTCGVTFSAVVDTCPNRELCVCRGEVEL